ncbi:F-box protein SKIP23-like [Silene latifolia]|uniref:F-box protein SKIP23-like n=1 Tax=Silene latifolia TaxID=37657 RepID=UPI003D7826ED
MAVVDWSTLPLDLLGDIAMRLEMIEDFIYFSAVCSTWKRVSSLIKHQWRPIPVPRLLLSENTSNNPHCVRKIFNPSNNKCYNMNLPETFGTRCWGSDCGWVAMVDRDLNVRLFNPITKSEIRFPSAETIPDRPPYVEERDGSEEDYINWVLGLFFIRLTVLKVSETEFVIVVLYGDLFQVVFAKNGDQSWTSVFVRQEPCVRICDVVAMDGYIFALYNDATLVYWNIEDFQGHELVKPVDYVISKFKMFQQFLTGIGALYLVQSGSDLLMVLRFRREVPKSGGNDHDVHIPYETFRFSVYRLDPKDRRWEKIEDHATLFVGCNSTMCVSAKSLQPNCVYFADDLFDLYGLVEGIGAIDMGVYDIKCEKTWRFYKGDDIGDGEVFNPPTWFIPQL